MQTAFTSTTILLFSMRRNRKKPETGMGNSFIIAAYDRPWQITKQYQKGILRKKYDIIFFKLFGSGRYGKLSGTMKQSMRKISGRCWKGQRRLLTEGDMLRLRTKEGSVKGIGHGQFMQDMYALGNGLCRWGLRTSTLPSLGRRAMNGCYPIMQLRAGQGVVVPIDKELPDDEIANILEDSGASCLIFSGEYADTVEKIRSGLPKVKHYIDMNAPADTPEIKSFGALVAEGKATDLGFSQRKIDENAMTIPALYVRDDGKKQGRNAFAENIISAAEGGSAFWTLEGLYVGFAGSSFV